MLRSIPGSIQYKSFDNMCGPDDALYLPMEFFNSSNVPGLLPYNGFVKIDSLIIILRNVYSLKFYCRTHIYVKSLFSTLIRVTYK